MSLRAPRLFRRLPVKQGASQSGPEAVQSTTQVNGHIAQVVPLPKPRRRGKKKNQDVFITAPRRHVIIQIPDPQYPRLGNSLITPYHPYFPSSHNSPSVSNYRGELDAGSYSYDPFFVSAPTSESCQNRRQRKRQAQHMRWTNEVIPHLGGLYLEYLRTSQFLRQRAKVDIGVCDRGCLSQELSVHCILFEGKDLKFPQTASQYLFYRF